MSNILQFPTVKALLRKQAKKVIDRLVVDVNFKDELSLKLLELQQLMRNDK